MAFRMGIDVGGTFTDLAVVDESGEFRMFKSPTTPLDPIQGITSCLKQCAAAYGMELDAFFRKEDVFLIHGSTVSTNAVIQRKGAKVGLICTQGTKHILWRREGGKKENYNHYIPFPQPLVPPYLCLEINERINAEGGVELPLDEDSVRAAVRQLKEWKVEAIGVSLLWSVANDAHELRVKQIIEAEWPGVPISLSSQVQPIINEYRRTSGVAFDAMLKPIIIKYFRNVREALAQYGFTKEFLTVVSSGGIMTTSEVVATPVVTIFSAPSAGPTAGLFFGKPEGFEDVVTVDMGGTSFDVSAVMGGTPTITREAMAGEYPTGVVSVEVLTLGAGGGSVGWVDRGGLLQVGPESAGSEPGPACYGWGGEKPTVTDANLVLGYINPDYFWGGRMKVAPELSRKAIQERVARPLNISIEEAASGIHRVVNENMVGGILDMTVRRGIDPREFLLVSGGAAGAIHVARIARELDMKHVVIPKVAPVLCAMGMLASDVTFSYVGSKYADTKRFDFDSVNAKLAELEARAKAAMDREGIPEDGRRFEYYVAARYPMQIYEIDVPLRAGRFTREMIPQLEADFHDAHEKRYAVRDDASHIECTDWRVLGIGIMPKMALKELSYAGEDSSKAVKGRRSAYFEEQGGFVDTPVYAGDKLGYGMIISGPAIIEDELTTTVVIPGSKITVNNVGSYLMELS